MSTTVHESASGLRTFTFHPSGPIRGTAILIHGHGDYSSRYEPILEPFLKQGICCLSTDLPGHGESVGKRGFVGNLSDVDRIVSRNREQARSLCPDGPLALLGHSVGGLLALRELLHRHQHYDLAWISSPLLRPDSTRPPWVVALLKIVGRLFPKIPMNTGVKAEDCRHFEDAAEEEEWIAGHFHSQISLGWALALLSAAREISEGFRAASPGLPVLFTQGGADPVCRPEFLRAFLEQAALPRATHLEFEGLLHEPFADIKQDLVREAIADWLQATLGSLPQESSPSG